MLGLVFTGHGIFPEGVKSSTEMISGNIEQCEVVSLEPEDDPTCFGEKLKNAVKNVDTGDGVLILTDIRGGTPFNQSLILSREMNVQIVVGTNIPTALTAKLARNENTTLDEIADIILSEAQDSIDIVKFNI